jgi:hypothetical protein
MKAITEFPSFTLTKAIQTKAALAAEGKSPEEIQASLGETFKLADEKLKHFINSIEVAASNKDNLKRVVVLTLSEGEKAPAKAVQVEETHYVPEFLTTARPAAPAEKDHKGRGNRKGGKQDGKKGSPWGLSPEEKAAKNK